MATVGVKGLKRSADSDGWRASTALLTDSLQAPRL